MDKKHTLPRFTIIACWIVTSLAFAIEFWHAHLGLKELKPLSWEYGSLVVSGIILLVLIVTYSAAISGVKHVIWIYLLCATFMFIFNLNSFYPTYLGKKLIKEDAAMLKDTLERYSTVLTDASKINVKETFQKVALLKNYQNTFNGEMDGTTGTNQGFGEKAKSTLKAFNDLAVSNIDLGTTHTNFNDDQKRVIIRNVNKQMDDAIQKFILNQSAGGRQGYLLAINKLKMDSLILLYSPILTAIQADTTTFNIDSVKKNPSIKKMKELAAAFDGISKPVNTELKTKLLPELDNNDNQVAVPQTQELGRIAHTLSSVGKRINKIDTLAMILVCLFIDFVVPLSMFLVLKNNNPAPEKSFKGGPSTY